MQRPKMKFVYSCFVSCLIVLVFTHLWAGRDPGRPHPPGLNVELSISSTCDGKRVYMYDLPSEFNSALLEKCNYRLVSWMDFCAHFVNCGFGQPIVNSPFEIFKEDWYGTDAYMLEVIFYTRMQTYRCLTLDPAVADAYFIPFFAGLDALPYLYTADMRSKNQGIGLVSWLAANGSKWWHRRGGRDHFLVAGRTGWDFQGSGTKTNGWGTHLFHLPEIMNVTKLVLERNPNVETEQAIPYPTSFHPSTETSLEQWIQRVRSVKRTHLFSFSGAPRPTLTESIRGILLQQCMDTPTQCSLLDCSKMKCSHNPEPIYEKLIYADFCLQPRGDTPTRRSTFDSIIAGCIPVFFHDDSAYTQYTWHLPKDRETYSIFLSEDAIRNGLVVKNVLASYSSARIKEMRETLISLIPNVLYGHPGGDRFKDAFDSSIEGVLHQIAAMKEPLHYEHLN